MASDGVAAPSAPHSSDANYTKPAITKRVIMHPLALSSGPESGLCNQIFALIGYAIMAKRSKAELVLPAWLSHDGGGYDMVFERLFEPEPFVRSMHRIGIAVLRTPPPHAAGMNIFRPNQLSGWKTYKLMQHKFVNVSAFEEAVLLGLQPAQQIRRQVRAAHRTYLGGLQYGCLHARIERDMVKSWAVNRAGPPPRLGPTLTAMKTERMITSFSRILVAVGVAITQQDDATLNQPTSWNASMVRVQSGKAYHRNPDAKNTSVPSYIEPALVDFQLCREAEWLVGWPGSTFARTVAFYHTHERGAWFLSCGNGTQWHEMDRDKWRDHQACMHAPNVNPFRVTNVTSYSGDRRIGSYDFSGLEEEIRQISSAGGAQLAPAVT